MTKQLQEMADALTGKIKIKLVPKSTPTSKYVEKTNFEDPPNVGGSFPRGNFAWQLLSLWIGSEPR
jgi:hypothetical protein